MAEATIYAPASATAKSGIVVIRISGPRAMAAMEALASKVGKPRYATYTKIYHPVSKLLIDECISIFYPGPASFTGEDVVELNIHGGRAVLKLTLDALSKVEGLRLAEPGEFSRRSFMNDKMDLTQAEALMDLIDAETEAQHRQALRQLSGSLGELCDGWRAQLLKNISLIEAYIDFPDEDLPPDIIAAVELNIANLANAIALFLTDDHKGERLRDGLYIAILGRTNVGKSSLLNALAKRDVAIVSDIAGTTRDVIEVHLDIDGYPVTIADTAGIRETSDCLEEQGIARSYDRASKADLKLLMVDASTQDYELASSFVDDNTIIIVNKIDQKSADWASPINNKSILEISAKYNTGIEKLVDELRKRVGDYFFSGETPLITRARHRENLQNTLLALNEFNLAKDIELAAEDLRLAARYLGVITGRIDVETILGEIFSNFCIGK